MIVESNIAIAIATLSDWLKTLVPLFQAIRSKTNTTLQERLFLRLRKLQLIARNSYWFVALLGPVVIGLWHWFFGHLKTVLISMKTTQ